jgi:hypothetical protein
MKLRGWLAIGFGAYVAYAVGSQINWGYYKHSGDDMAGALAWPITAGASQEAKARGAALAGEVCGVSMPDFNYRDRSAKFVAMPEQAEVKHFFINGKYSNVIWLGVGWKGRFCMARYAVTMKDEGRMSPIPWRLFPFPRFEWLYQPWIQEQHLIERIPNRPVAPEGVQSLLPGECTTGMIAKGETVRFQMVLPRFGQKVEVDCDWDRDTYGGCKNFEWRKDGHVLSGESDEPGGGTYTMAIHAPPTEAKHYRLRLFWGNLPSCALPDGWTYRGLDAQPDEP